MRKRITQASVVAALRARGIHNDYDLASIRCSRYIAPYFGEYAEFQQPIGFQALRPSMGGGVLILGVEYVARREDWRTNRLQAIGVLESRLGGNWERGPFDRWTRHPKGTVRSALQMEATDAGV